MNREMRRHPQQVKPKPGRKPPALRPAPSGGGPGNVGRPHSRGSLLRPTWATEIFSEVKKVQWPTRHEAWNLTLVVLLVSVVLGIALGGIDTGFGWFMQHTLLK